MRDAVSLEIVGRESEESRGNERRFRETGAPASMSASVTNAKGSRSSSLPHRLPTCAFGKTIAIGAGRLRDERLNEGTMARDGLPDD